MRQNLPVTQREFQFPRGETLLSTTDTSSHISYANAAFLRTSGFDTDELMGQPHNLVRHPDMPVEAFADMWRSLKDEQSWTALVKNRRKNGDHYWVRANAAPMRRNGQIVGYLSVRTKPSRAEVEATEELYRRFQEGRASGLAFHRGLIVRTGLMRWTSARQLLPTAWRVRLPLLGVGAAMGTALSFSGLGGAALAGMGAALAASLLLADWLIESQLTSPLKKILGTAQQVASGEAGEDLNLNRCDDLGLIARAINQAGLNLHSLVADAGQTMTEVVGQVKRVNDLIAEITSASREQATGIAQVAQAVSQLDGMTQQNAAMVEQSSAAANSMSEQAQRLVEAVKVFSV